MWLALACPLALTWKTDQYQPRYQMGGGCTISAESIKTQGIMQPILVSAIPAVRTTVKYRNHQRERRFPDPFGERTACVLVRDVPDGTAAMSLIETSSEDLHSRVQG
jgi:hypothetical protein